ncbi:hypothetical protein KQX54_020814 [Cotesia glomerata]|uniref:Uncharacterized protein n=1 Tax=Cotesia glomerata TaxID=32391 RepID=A0AAV7IK15_COTGL|nr:hypothetical protein KQX54_020814 [Cotesia glomerata]
MTREETREITHSKATCLFFTNANKKTLVSSRNYFSIANITPWASTYWCFKSLIIYLKKCYRAAGSPASLIGLLWLTYFFNSFFFNDRVFFLVIIYKWDQTYF